MAGPALLIFSALFRLLDVKPDGAVRTLARRPGDGASQVVQQSIKINAMWER
jgi:hypothetical protein